jgi:hypothetical protein
MTPLYGYCREVIDVWTDQAHERNNRPRRFHVYIYIYSLMHRILALSGQALLYNDVNGLAKDYCLQAFVVPSSVKITLCRVRSIDMRQTKKGMMPNA